MSGNYGMEACYPRHPGPRVDGVTEIRCKAKGLQVIAAERCLRAQADGCSCERMASADVVKEAHTVGKEIAPQRQLGSAGVSSIEARARRVVAAQISARLAMGQTRDTVAEALGLTLGQIDSLLAWAKKRQRTPKQKPPRAADRVCACGKVLGSTNRSGSCKRCTDNAKPSAHRRTRCARPGCRLFSVRDGLCSPCAFYEDRRRARGAA